MVELRELYQSVLDKITSIGDFSYVFQYQTQDIDQENTSVYSYPAALIELDIESVTQLIQRSDYNVLVNIHILEKEMEHTMYGSVNLTGKIYKSLQGQHFDNLCSPLYYSGLLLDKEPLNFSKTIMTFNTILTVREFADMFTYSVASPTLSVSYTYDQVQGSQSRTDHFTYSN